MFFKIITAPTAEELDQKGQLLFAELPIAEVIHMEVIVNENFAYMSLLVRLVSHQS